MQPSSGSRSTADTCERLVLGGRQGAQPEPLVLGGRQGAGRRPVLVIVDLCNGFTDPTSPLQCEADDAVTATASLLRCARDAARPVMFTTVSYEDAGLRDAEAFLAKVPALAMLADGSPWPRIDERITPREGEPVVRKLFASGFFGTDLHALLTAAGCDTVLLCGASTSGCVRRPPLTRSSMATACSSAATRSATVTAAPTRRA